MAVYLIKFVAIGQCLPVLEEPGYRCVVGEPCSSPEDPAVGPNSNDPQRSQGAGLFLVGAAGADPVPWILGAARARSGKYAQEALSPAGRALNVLS